MTSKGECFGYENSIDFRVRFFNFDYKNIEHEIYKKNKNTGRKF